MSEQRKTDRRSVNTEEIIINSYLELLSQKKRDDISIIDISKKSGVHKSTIYRHFRNISEIELSIENNVIDRFRKSLKGTDFRDFLLGRRSFLEKLSLSVKDDLYFCKSVFVLNNSIVFLERINTRLINMLKAELMNHTSISDSQAEIIYTFIIGGRIAVFRKWIMDGFSLSVDEMENILERISTDCFTGLFDIFNL